MMNILIMIRDFLIASALAWVGVSIQSTVVRENTKAPACASEQCERDAR